MCTTATSFTPTYDPTVRALQLLGAGLVSKAWVRRELGIEEAEEKRIIEELQAEHDPKGD